jgi:hypothetical protein
MNQRLSPILTQAVKDNPDAELKLRRDLTHPENCHCTRCTPVLLECMWFGDSGVNNSDLVPRNKSCTVCHRKLTIAVRGILEVIGEYTLVNRWYNRCCTNNTTSVSV